MGRTTSMMPSTISAPTAITDRNTSVSTDCEVSTRS